MNYPAASCGVSKEVELFLVQLNVLCTLLLDVLLDRCFVAMLPNRADEISSRPELSAPEQLLDLWTGLKDFSGRDAFDNLHNSLRAVEWH